MASPPDHEDYRLLLGRKPVRAMMAASAAPLGSPHFVAVSEPRNPSDPWTTDPTGITKMFRRFRNFMRKPPSERIASLRRRHFRTSRPSYVPSPLLLVARSVGLIMTVPMSCRLSAGGSRLRGESQASAISGIPRLVNSSGSTRGLYAPLLPLALGRGGGDTRLSWRPRSRKAAV